MKKRWGISESLSEEQQLLKKEITLKIKCPDLIAELLIRKGISDLDEIEKFFNPRLEDTFDSFLFHDMEKLLIKL